MKIVVNRVLSIHFLSMLHLPVSPLEKQLTRLIAVRWTHPRLDHIMIVISDPYRWMLPALSIMLVLLYFDWGQALKALIAGGFGAAIADGINTKILKQHTDRIRPGKQFDDIRSLGIMNRGKKSFPSNHASNTMAFALGLGLFFPIALPYMVLLSMLVGYSRIYCGAHFPLDVLAGWLHGGLWVMLIFFIYMGIQ